MESNQNRHQLSERFEAAFNRIHDQLCSYAQEHNQHVSFTEVLQKARTKHQVIDVHFDLLKQCTKLRNAMVHRKIDHDFYIAEPHEDVVDEIERLSKQLEQPPAVTTIASQPVEFFYSDTPLRKILQTIQERGFSQYPIYQNQQFTGLLTESGITQWLSAHSQDVTIEQTTAKDVLSFEENNHVSFLAQSANIFDIQMTFDAYLKHQRKLEAIIITEGGVAHQLPVAIVTSWDLMKYKPLQFPIIQHT
ncbi:hypothetical protein J416_07962 [Gracilibacillus halophilus YIM-C55.5]|uniref:CBS domain-containing protein n=1 Tax=Gracilibacillus halophilus YIM-C55.5 TaxID=1308866 RepID=N4WV90_9BACI|nr:CBS domain-containing protein [Gracilibacillus halophilus]ENH96996.1 hypothetical protein J416_07962 [Gracilibacillus halophilus YIM-C55.5]